MNDIWSYENATQLKLNCSKFANMDQILSQENLIKCFQCGKNKKYFIKCFTYD